MHPGMTNLELAAKVLELAYSFGVREFCVGAGFRNSPFLRVLGENQSLSTFSFFDERSAAFFAYGQAKRKNRPVAVITTSGTAVAELLPAVIEAFYSAVPLLLITADRPRRFRGTGAPQSIEQPGLFGVYVEASLDLSSDLPLPPIHWSAKQSLHLNVCFDEPLLTGQVPSLRLTSIDPLRAVRDEAAERASRAIENFLENAGKPLLIMGALQGEDRTAVRDFALRLGAAVYAEPLSGLREEPALDSIRFISGERILGRGDFDAVLRIGGVPALRFWRDLEQTSTPVLSVSPSPFAGLSRGSHLTASIKDAIDNTTVRRSAAGDKMIDEDRRMHRAISNALDQEPDAELSLLRSLSSAIPRESFIFLGNSLPVREWDLVASRDHRAFDLGANRGANGIDGELSTFLGMARRGQNWAILGDLTTLYDLSAPWIIAELDPAADLRILIINNGGGQIFARVPGLEGVDRAIRSRLFQTEHTVRFRGWAEMWGLHYERWTTIGDVASLPSRAVIEIVPDAPASQRLWSKLDQLWSNP